MFGEIEDLANAGSFNDQNHSIGPTLFWNPGGGRRRRGQSEGGDDDEKAAGPPDMELSFNVGVQFGLTDATSDRRPEIPGLALLVGRRISLPRSEPMRFPLVRGSRFWP